jgi:general secretion pathway protein B
MSYILEALKKAQAERQLGNAPTIHAPAISPAPQNAGGRKPLVIGFAAGAVLVAGALFAWRQQPAATGQVADAGKAATQLAAASQPAAHQASAASPSAPLPVSANQPGASPVTAPVAADATARVALVQDPAGAAHPGGASPRPSRAQPASQLKAAAPEVAPPAPSPAHGPAVSQPVLAPAAAAKVAAHDVVAAPPAPTGAEAAVVARPAAATPASSADETLRTVNELPEQIRFSLPKVAFGGYMYSPNPGDRLVLVDKALRHEGEEVAPGLVLEKLLPKAAVMNYRGYRYRVPL